MRNKITLFLGFLMTAFAVSIFLNDENQKDLPASMFLHTQSTSAEQLFIPSDYIAVPGEAGEVSIKTGESYPDFARKDVMGMYFEFSWPKEKMEFLGAILSSTEFENKEYEITIDHNIYENTARVTVWTSESFGIDLPKASDLLTIMVSVRDNAELGDEIAINLLDAEVVYDRDLLQSYVFSNLQGGVIRVGDPENPEMSSEKTGDLYFEDDLLAKPGEERVVLLKSNITQDIAGMMLDLEYPESSLEFLGFETSSTPLEEAGFEFVIENDIENHIGALIVTGRKEGAQIESGQNTIGIRFLIREDVPIGETLPLSMRKMEVVENHTLQKSSLSVDEGSILVSPVSSLRLEDAIPLSSSSIRLVFSDEIIQGDMDDVAFNPRLKNSNTEFEIEGSSIILRNLTTMIPGETYRINAQEQIVGNISGTLSPEYNFAFFRGFPSQYPISKFRIKEATSTSNTTLQVSFTEPVNPQSIEAEDFQISGLNVFSAELSASDDTIVILETGSQSSLSGSQWLSINNTSDIHDIRSTSGELLSLNSAPFVPFGQTSQGPQITKIEAYKTDIAEVSFNKSVLGSSINLDDFTITESGRTNNLITAETMFDIAPDHKSIIFYNVRTVAGRNYEMRIEPGSIRTNETGQAPMTLVGNIGSFIGQGSFFTPWDFALESVEPIGPEKLLITFSEEVFAEDTLSPLHFEIWTRDSAELSRKLRVISAEIEQNSILLTTEVQQEDTSYFVLVDDEVLQSAYGESLGIPSGLGFLGYSSGRMRAVNAEPKAINIGEEAVLNVSGVHFPEDARIRIGSTTLPTTFVSQTELQATAPSSLEMGAYDIVVVSSNGEESRIPYAIIVTDPDIEARMSPKVLSEESYASPYRVPNDNSTTTNLWVRIEDPRGVSDIEKVTVDLRQLDQEASKHLELHEFIDGKAWYKLEGLTVPSTVPTSEYPTFIPVTVENKTGRKGFGTVELLVNRDLESSLPPVIESATASPPQVSPGDSTEVTFQVEVSDPDGGGNLARVVLDASQVGLGIIVLQPLDEIQEDRECTRSDYSIGDWSECIDSVQRRIVDIKPGIECKENDATKPDEERACSGGVCTRADWERESDCGPCYWPGTQYCDYVKKADSTCLGEDNKPAREEVDCVYENTDTSMNLLDLLVPKAKAVSIFGNRIWYQSNPYLIEDWVPEGTYELPLTVIDREGTEVKGILTITITRDSIGTPRIDEDDIFISPKYSIPNDARTEFQIFAKATDPNGHEDITTVTVNLSPIGLPPVEMTKGQIEGTGAWYSTDRLTIPRSVIPGYRTITISATDEDGNVTEEEIQFHVSTPETSGDAPEIPTEKAYTNPRALLNDQQTRGTLYVFVEEGDAPISHVSANLGTILQISSESDNKEDQKENDDEEEFALFKRDSSSRFFPQARAEIPDDSPSTGDEDETSGDADGDAGGTQNGTTFECNSTDTFGCMIPSVQEGERGQWFYLPNLIVRENVPASIDPYFISIVATDTDGRSSETEVPIFVTDGVLPVAEQGLPYLVSAVSTERNKVQAYFSSALNPQKIRSNAFDITFFGDRGSKLPIKGYDVQSDARLVSLETNYMNPGDRLSLFADAEVLGLRQDRQTDNLVHFTVHSIHEQKKFFEIEKVESVGLNAVEVRFRKDLKFSSVLADGSNFTITTKGTDKVLPVLGAQITDSKTVILSTGLQIPGNTYVLRASEVQDFSGKELRKGTDIKSFASFGEYGSNDFVITTKAEKEIYTPEEDVVFITTIKTSFEAETLNDVILMHEYSDTLSYLSLETGGSFSCENDGATRTIRCKIQTIPPEAEYTITTRFKSAKVGSGGYTIRAYEGEETASNFESPFAYTSGSVAIIDPGSPFIIEKTPNKVDAGINEEVEFRISITNRTDGKTYTDVSIVDDFPEQMLKLLEVTDLGELSCQNDASEVQCVIPTFEPGRTYTFFTRFIAIKEGLVTNTVIATAQEKQNFTNNENGELAPTKETSGAASSNLYIQNPFLNSDFNDDGAIDFLDFSIFASVYGTSGYNLPDADLDKNGKVDFLDFSIFAQQYGLTKETAPVLFPEHEETGNEGFGGYEADYDEDGIQDDNDNCPKDANPEQEDADSDGIGDACEGKDLPPSPPDF